MKICRKIFQIYEIIKAIHTKHCSIGQIKYFFIISFCNGTRGKEGAPHLFPSDHHYFFRSLFLSGIFTFFLRTLNYNIRSFEPRHFVCIGSKYLVLFFKKNILRRQGGHKTIHQHFCFIIPQAIQNYNCYVPYNKKDNFQLQFLKIPLQYHLKVAVQELNKKTSFPDEKQMWFVRKIDLGRMKNRCGLDEKQVCVTHIFCSLLNWA